MMSSAKQIGALTLSIFLTVACEGVSALQDASMDKDEEGNGQAEDGNENDGTDGLAGDDLLGDEGSADDGECNVPSTLRLEPVEVMVYSPAPYSIIPLCSEQASWLQLEMRLYDHQSGSLLWERRTWCDGSGIDIGPLPSGEYEIATRYKGDNIREFIRGWIGDFCQEKKDCVPGVDGGLCAALCINVGPCGQTIVPILLYCCPYVDDGCGF